MAPEGFDRRTALKAGLVTATAAGAAGLAAPPAFGTGSHNARPGAVAEPRYVLPELDYDYAALEPHISAEINELHHSKHHAGYVKGANETLEKLAVARDTNAFDDIVGLETTLAFNLAGHANHVLWWKILSPEGGGQPTGQLAAAIDDSFGSFDKFKAHFTAVATTIQGNGWAALSWDPLGKVLVIQQLRDHHNNLILPTTPIMMADIWEHAFYLQYRNVKSDYVAALWNVYNWAEIGRRFDQAVASGS